MSLKNTVFHALTGHKPLPLIIALLVFTSQFGIMLGLFLAAIR